MFDEPKTELCIHCSLKSWVSNLNANVEAEIHGWTFGPVIIKKSDNRSLSSAVLAGQHLQ
jgi:hypothetical protein